MELADKGLQYRRFGGWRGYYRCFEIRESSGCAEAVAIAVIGTEPTQSESKRKRTTLLIVAIDGRDYPTLELSLDKFCCHYRTSYKIWHNGTMRIKDVRVTKDQVLAYAKQQAPELRRVGEWIELGTLDNSHAISWEQNETKDFIGNLIKYALIRDEFRKTKN
jgi:hypothetical protein